MSLTTKAIDTKLPIDELGIYAVPGSRLTIRVHAHRPEKAVIELVMLVIAAHVDVPGTKIALQGDGCQRCQSPAERVTAYNDGKVAVCLQFGGDSCDHTRCNAIPASTLRSMSKVLSITLEQDPTHAVRNPACTRAPSVPGTVNRDEPEEGQHLPGATTPGASKGIKLICASVMKSSRLRLE